VQKLIQKRSLDFLTIPLNLGMEKLFLSWQDIHTYLSDIHSKTKHLDQNAGIVGLSRGGLVPAVMLAHLKGISTFYTSGIKSYDEENKTTEIMFQYPDKNALKDKDTVYVVDDICDTGGTLKFIENYLLPIKIISITLVYRTNDVYKPNYFGTQLSDKRWIVFPWEETK
jgi:xanthine phosphoribosyltransferase